MKTQLLSTFFSIVLPVAFALAQDNRVLRKTISENDFFLLPFSF